MTDPLARLRRFLQELKRRNVYKVAVAYMAVAFVGLQAAQLLVPATTLPGWADELVIFLAVFGFPIALVLAWAFEMTPEGVRRTETPEGERSGGGAYQWIGLALVVLLAGGVWYATAGDGGEPAVETTATTDTTAARTTSTARDTAGPPRIAVLPFENIAPDSADDYFAQGMHEEVLNQLSKVSGLEVISRTSVMRYADTDKPVPVISEELGGVNALLEGTVRRAGDQVRITTQLIGAPEDEHLWSNTYDRALSVEEIFRIQADIAQQIAGSLETELAEGERRRIESTPTGDLAAYDAYLRGRRQWFRYMATADPLHLRRSTENLREAVRRDSAFAEARAWLGLAYNQRANMSGDERWADSAAASVKRARGLDSNLPSVHLAQAFVHRWRDSTAAQIGALRKALQLQPSHSLAKAELSEALEERGRYVEAVRVAREATHLDPRNPLVLEEMADQLRWVGLYEASEAWDRRTLAIAPGHSYPTYGLAQTHSRRGDYEQALKTWQRFLRHREDLPAANYLGYAALGALLAGRPDQAKAYLEKIPKAKAREERLFGEQGPPAEEGGPGLLIRSIRGLIELRHGNESRGREILGEVAETLETRMEQAEGPPPLFLAKIRAALGQRERALELLERWASAAERVKPELKTDPLFTNLRSEPRFQKIIEELEANRKKYRREVLRLGLDLYPPRAEADTAN